MLSKKLLIIVLTLTNILSMLLTWVLSKFDYGQCFISHWPLRPQTYHFILAQLVMRTKNNWKRVSISEIRHSSVAPSPNSQQGTQTYFLSQHFRNSCTLPSRGNVSNSKGRQVYGEVRPQIKSHRAFVFSACVRLGIGGGERWLLHPHMLRFSSGGKKAKCHSDCGFGFLLCY